jgi:hypothetical protein
MNLFNFHEDDVNHMVVVGPSGHGMAMADVSGIEGKGGG